MPGVPCPPRATAASDIVSYAFQNVEQNGTELDEPLYIDADHPSRFLSSIQVHTLVRKLVAGLDSVGLCKGDRVVVHLFNSYLYPAIFFGIIGAGGIYVGSNPAYRFYELDHLFQTAEPALVITSSDLLPSVLEVASAHKLPAVRIFCLDVANFNVPRDCLATNGSTIGGTSHLDMHTGTPKDFKNLLEHGQQDWQRLDDKAAKSTPAAYFLTSGTSGSPKAAVLSHSALIGQHEAVHHRVPFKVIKLMTMPFFHIFGTLFGHIAPLRYRERLHVCARFHTDTYLEYVQRYKPTNLFMAPPMLYSILESSLKLEDVLDSVKYVVCGGEGMSTAKQQELFSKLPPDAVVTQAWGMTEIGCVSIFQWPEQDNSGSVGRQLPGSEIKLVNGHGQEISEDSQLGEAYVRTSQRLLEYRTENGPQRAYGDDDEWTRTGDILYQKMGKFYVHGRSKELIKVKGWQVSPVELETVLRQHPDVSDVAVVGVHIDDGLTEAPRAFVVRKAGSATQEELYQYSRERLASFKALSGGVVFVDQIPRTVTGKIQRYKLKNMLSAEVCMTNCQQVPGQTDMSNNEVQDGVRKPSDHLLELDSHKFGVGRARNRWK